MPKKEEETTEISSRSNGNFVIVPNCWIAVVLDSPFSSSYRNSGVPGVQWCSIALANGFFNHLFLSNLVKNPNPYLSSVPYDVLCYQFIKEFYALQYMCTSFVLVVSGKPKCWWLLENWTSLLVHLNGSNDWFGSVRNLCHDWPLFLSVKVHGSIRNVVCKFWCNILLWRAIIRV